MKVNDKVRIKQLTVFEVYGGHQYNREMSEMAGEERIVIEVIEETANCPKHYKLENSHWDWTDEMLEIINFY
jgi:hypothetical protein